ncbi:GNAT family N-acetyltransferase [Pseudomonas protegens]|jgi:GNAT superfamily N-acetyltransferase|uniref:Acetyltransferase, GNAT family n=2 Tax=Pseudomonas protegens TaxID=380021 RepID=Q4K3H5_PSEF5|nr:GNAT family N-acetyltransferase [Pseudomonas protegens]AAY95338.1 acetyltransferase, GNAT family [Pseudomonas protegens Pf-5]ASE20521.1 N-acetyltransferase [Pseudomonas protegens]QEZ49911.1 GNAT family N-acetyltransferase [Pseudomonas protegens]QEZ57994.1 GNAT family N-acetyltransferase [Pseudomonas protegens]QEZ67089.1 GNAT family N-acetyltransferase [Pseudomonas protegens]
MRQIQIRPVTAADHSAWLPLWQAYLRFYETELADAVTQSTWQRFLDPSEPTNAALAWDGERAVGLVHFIYHRSNWSIESSCYLQDLLVTPDQRGTGVGRQLIEFVYTQAKQDGCAKVHWLTHETNATAIQLYERIAERPGFIQFRKPL